MWGFQLGLRAIYRGMSCRSDVQVILRSAFSGLMRLPTTAGELVAVALEGLTSNLWGYRCPIYCVQPSFSLLGLTFLVGTLFGFGLALWFLRVSIGFSPEPPRHPAAEVPRSVARLLLYGREGQ